MKLIEDYLIADGCDFLARRGCPQPLLQLLGALGELRLISVAGNVARVGPHGGIHDRNY